MMGWIKDEEESKLFWVLDNYGDEGIRKQTWYVEGVIKYYRSRLIE